VPSRFASLVITSWGYKAGGRSYATYIFLQDLPPSPPPPLRLKRKRNRETYLEDNGNLLSLRGVISPSPLIYDGVVLDRIRGQARAPTKTYKSGVYDSSGVSYLLCARRSCILCSGGGIRCGVHGVLQWRVRCAITLISLLLAIVLWLGAASHDFLGDPTYGGLRDPVRSQYGD
jgi:hypothetical protein